MSLKMSRARRKAFLLSLTLGTFGAHRFYMNQNYRAMGYLIFSWTLVPTVLSFIDAAFLMQMSDTEYEEENIVNFKNRLAA